MNDKTVLPTSNIYYLNYEGYNFCYNLFYPRLFQNSFSFSYFFLPTVNCGHIVSEIKKACGIRIYVYNGVKRQAASKPGWTRSGRAVVLKISPASVLYLKCLTTWIIYKSSRSALHFVAGPSWSGISLCSSLTMKRLYLLNNGALMECCELNDLNGKQISFGFTNEV